MANVANALNPLWVDRNTDLGIGVDALAARYGLGNLGQPRAGGTFAHASGVYAGTGNAQTYDDMRVATASPTPNMTTRVLMGGAQVPRSNRGPYQATATGALTATHSASNASNPRKDYVVARIRDAYDGTPNQTFLIVVLQGAPASTPVEPIDQVGDGDLLLACVTVRANTTQIVESDIEDRRNFVAARGGIYVKSAVDERPGAYYGQMRFNPARGMYEAWTATTWVPVASLFQWQEYTPKMQSTGGVFTDTSNLQDVNLGTGGIPQAIGRWSLLGRTLTWSVFLKMGASGYFAGPGDIVVPLPTAPNGQQFTNPGYNQWINAHLWVNTAQMVNDFVGSALMFAGTKIAAPFFPTNTSTQNSKVYRISYPVATPGSGVPYVPGGYPQGGELTISGVFETVVPA